MAASNTSTDTYPGMLEPPPPGETVDRVHSESIAGRLIVTSVLCPAITLIFCATRLYTANRIVRKMRLDDWMITGSFLCAIGASVLNTEQTKNGIGLHAWNVTSEQFVHFGILGVPCLVLYNLSTLLTKSSILLFYLRFAAANFPFRVAAYLVMSVVVAYTLLSACSMLYYCSPIEKLWDVTAPGSCIDMYAAFFALAVFNSATDVVILLLPIWLLWPLRVKLSQRIAVGLVLMTGGFVCCVSFIRVAAIPAGRFDMDITWRITLNLIWCIIEMYVGIICACLPCLKAFATYHFPGVFDIKPVPTARETLNFNNSSRISVRLRALTKSTGVPRETESVDQGNVLPLQSKDCTSVLGSTATEHPLAGASEEGSPKSDDDCKSKSSATGTHAMDQASIV